ncbi:winged helix-turn-helix domain-containing protein [Sphingomonas segetis]|jgi:DNA-binding winged helix-turn-helix (wHTH) protein/tetratricopeptide (TPR) repeat protein|uniref:winged helix-turn-helix domain-containing protein n=1 Tax=Sphingomonas segetis TaxID=1104779 RepID=UPI0018AD4A70|nr:winged helix-turn-helix domain-containing protein [Sphingomonas segetis]
MAASDRVELAHEPDFVIGRLTVSPSRRQLVRDDGERKVIEHRIMQVLVALSKAEGRIVTRDELIILCWDGRFVGEDAIHRVISQLRKIADGIGAGSLEIETITKIGYRLTSEGPPVRELVGVIDRSPAQQNALSSGVRRAGKRKIAAVAVITGLVFAIGLAGWKYARPEALPIVAVEATDSSSPSQALARDLLVKLGTLPQVGSGRWQLVDAGSAKSTPSLVFRTTARNPAAGTSLALLDGTSNSLLWSREFSFPAGRESDLRQHLSLTAARVLGCALEARAEVGLPPDLLRLFLNGCAASAETSAEDPQTIARTMRAIVTQRPSFAPAWARLLILDTNVLQSASGSGDPADAREALRRDIETARKFAPDLTETKLAQLELLPSRSYAERLNLLRELKTEAPDNPQVWVSESGALSDVGRMQAAVAAARRAVALDPLSPAMSSNLIFMLACSGATDLAKEELARAERLWPGTGALRDAQFGFYLRYGDPRVARTLIRAGHPGQWADAYLQARLEPSPANVDRLLRSMELRKSYPPYWAAAVQALGKFHKTEEAFEWVQQASPSVMAESSYVLFRPALADVRRDLRFMQVAKRIGLIDYWQKSGRWPDFCLDPGLPYDCRQEAARLAS